LFHAVPHEALQFLHSKQKELRDACKKKWTGALSCFPLAIK
jgi:hypothetical protein